jgi:Tfp pilus assembly protein PilV
VAVRLIRIGASRRARLRAGGASERGFTLIELLVAILVLIVGVLGVVSAFAASGKLTLTAEQGTSIAQRAQSELERVESLPFASLALTTMPSPSTNTASPDYYVLFVSAGPPAVSTFQPDRTSTNAETLVLDATNGVVPGTPVAWSDGRLSGFIYDFVTWATDTGCGSGCPALSYKRVTVEVTLTGAPAQSRPALLSTVVIDPNAAPVGSVSDGIQSVLKLPSTTCANALGVRAVCSNGLGNGTPQTWFFYDTPATASYAAPTASHATHPTVAASGTCTGGTTSGCPVPDLMGASPPASTTTPPIVPPLYVYSSEQQPADVFTGGRILKADAACASPPTATDNAKGELWVTAPLLSSTVFTGAGGMSIYTQTANSVAAGVTLCIGVYDVPGSITNLVASPPSALGVVSYTEPSWPTVLSPISLNFTFLASPATATIAAGHRLGLRIWVASSGGADIALAYDNPNYASQLELNTQ